MTKKNPNHQKSK